MAGFLEQIARTIERYRMVAGGETIGVAVSGGADSVCLLEVLRELAARWRLRLSVVHVNHGLRGEESEGDARFVRGMAERLGLEFHLREAQLATATGNLEEVGRRVRLQFFRELIAAGAVGRVATGHTRSDQAETVLFRFLRGAGSAGLAGIRPVRSDGMVRPLIEVDREQVVEFLRARGIAWREDSTNAGTEFARNRIRHALLPQLEREWNPGIRQVLAHTADWAQAEETYWEEETGRLAEMYFVRRGSAILIPTDRLQGLPLAASRRLVRSAIEGVRRGRRQVDFRHVQAVVDLAARAEGHGRVRAAGAEVRRSFGWLRVSPGSETAAGYCLQVDVPGVVAVPGSGLRLRLDLVERSETSDHAECVYNSGMGGLKWRGLSGSLELRSWRPGDHYQPSGSARDQKLKTLFQEARIPQWERQEWPLLTDGGEILWVRQFGPAAGMAASPGTKTILRIQECTSSE